MGSDQDYQAEVIRQAMTRAKHIDDVEKQLVSEKELRASDACWMVRNTTCSRTLIAAALRISRVTLDKYLADAGITREYLAGVRKVQQMAGRPVYDARDVEILWREHGV